MSKANVVAIIMARGGSKGVPKKNIKDLGGYPLIAYSIMACHQSKEIDRTIISTDCNEIAEIASQFGAEVPFIRPGEFATDKAPDYAVFDHALTWLKENENHTPEYFIQIRPTTPLRDSVVIDNAIKKIKETPEATGLISVHETQESAAKMFGMSDNFLHGLCPLDPRPEYFNLPRQDFPPTYFGNGYVDIIRSKTMLETQSLYGKRMMGFETPDFGEIDNPQDFDWIEFNLSRNTFSVYEELKKKFPRR